MKNIGKKRLIINDDDIYNYSTKKFKKEKKNKKIQRRGFVYCHLQ